MCKFAEGPKEQLVEDPWALSQFGFMIRGNYNCNGVWRISGSKLPFAAFQISNSYHILGYRRYKRDQGPSILSDLAKFRNRNWLTLRSWPFADYNWIICSAWSRCACPRHILAFQNLGYGYPPEHAARHRAPVADPLFPTGTLNHGHWSWSRSAHGHGLAVFFVEHFGHELFNSGLNVCIVCWITSQLDPPNSIPAIPQPFVCRTPIPQLMASKLYWLQQL